MCVRRLRESNQIHQRSNTGTGRSSDFMFLVLSELKHFPIENSKFRLDFLQSCENLREDIERMRKKASMDANEWSVQRNRVTRRSFDYAEDVDGDEEEERIVDNMIVEGHGIELQTMGGGKGSFGDNDDDFDTVEVFNDDVLRVEGKHIGIIRHEDEDTLIPPPLPVPSSSGQKKKLTFVLSPSRVRNMLFAEHESEATDSVLRGDFN